MDTESKIRKLIRGALVGCPSCGSDCISVEKENDTDIGIMDTIICSDCDKSFYMISSINTQFVPFNDGF